jgi:glycosyltransferase involved in cell wall biosynthesis
LYALKYGSLLSREHAASFQGLSYTARAKFHVFALRFADAILAISRSTANDLLERSLSLAQRQEVSYCDVPSIFKPAAKDRERFILYVGGFNTHKNVATLVRAHALLNDRVADPVRLVLAGYHGWPPIDLDAVIAEDGRADLIDVELRPSDERIIDLYQRCSLFCYLSAYEGFGLPVLEAIRCGAPVLVNDVSSLPELVPLEQCRVNAGSPQAVSRAMEHLLSSDVSGLVCELRDHARRFSFERAAARVLELL